MPGYRIFGLAWALLCLYTDQVMTPGELLKSATATLCGILFFGLCIVYKKTNPTLALGCGIAAIILPIAILRSRYYDRF